MSWKKFSAALAAVLSITIPAAAQHAQVTCVAFRPTSPNEVWTCNRDNNSVSVVDLGTQATVAEVDTGNYPRSLAFSLDGAKVFVACQRGNVAYNANFVTPFSGNEIRGQIYVIDANTRQVTATLNDVGTEPYGLAVAPNGKYFAVTGFRSGTVKFFDVQTLAEVASYQYLANLNFIPDPYTIADADQNRDGIADLAEPRGFVIRADSTRLFVTHHRSPYVSVLDVALDGNGVPTGVTLAAKVNTNDYPFDPIYNPALVQIIKSQGVPRFEEDIALSPDGSRALIPHVILNVNHDVNFDFGPNLPGAFANRIYPALTMIDAANLSYGQPGDNSTRLHHEHSDPAHPAEYYPYASPTPNGAGLAMLGAKGQPLIGASVTFVVDGVQPGQIAKVWLGRPTYVPLGSIGTQYVKPRFAYNVGASGEVSVHLPNSPSLNGVAVDVQAAFYNAANGQLERLSNPLKVVLGYQGIGVGTMGHRAGQPSRVAYNAAGDVALMLNRGSEDIFVYRVTGSSMQLATVFPPRHNFTPRAPLDTTTAMGDLPLGFAISPDAGTTNDDAKIVVMNEVTRTLSVLRVGFKTGTIFKDAVQIPTLLGTDVFGTSVRLGNELFEDASRPQTTGNFNNSCGSCHFEGGEDGNVWQRPVGPRSTIAVYGGTLLTGLGLWKGVRLNMGETGPMFGGENGGTGVFTDAEQQALIDFHETIPVPLNPNITNGQYTTLAAFGRDLYFGLNDTGLNPTLRHAGCASCHPDFDAISGTKRGYTADFLNPILSMGENLATFDPTCLSLQENIVALNIRNVNSGCNIDFDHDGQPELDRNQDGYVDLETYNIMNADTDAPFQRDDGNSYDCPIDPQDPNSPLKTFTRNMRLFSIPTKLGVFSSGPYFHDHVASSLRIVLDPEAQEIDPKYGTPAYGAPAFPGVSKLFNEFHDVRGHEQYVQGASKVQITLVSTNAQSDIEALLAYIQSL